MTLPNPMQPHSVALSQAKLQEGENFQKFYLWLIESMPAAFFKEVSTDNITLITHNFMGLNLQDYFSTINLKSAAIVICLENAEADLRILETYSAHGIQNYQVYVSKKPPPFPGITAPLRIVTLDFIEKAVGEEAYSAKSKEILRSLFQNAYAEVLDAEFEQLVSKLSTRFLSSLPADHLLLALNMLRRAQNRDSCQYEIRYEQNWDTKDAASMNIILAWRNTPKHLFLYRLAHVIYRHGLVVRGVNATYADPYTPQSILVMELSLHGSHGQPVWDACNIMDFIRELVTMKYFDSLDAIDDQLVNNKVISGSMGHMLRSMIYFIHQLLLHLDSNLYTLENIEEAFCRHPEFTSQICELFKLKFDPEARDLILFEEKKNAILQALENLDTGQEENDVRRKNIFKQGVNFIIYTLKTNFYRLNYTALSFRLDPRYLNEVPFESSLLFPHLPYGIFFIKGLHFFGFHIRFKDLARGGLRTIYPEQYEQMVAERNNVFTECYNLAWTQQQKNKDIPEGGAKAIIFLKPFERIESDSQILKRELEWSHIDAKEIDKKIQTFRQEQETEYLYQAQRAFIDSLLSIVNCESDGTLKERHIIDYWKRPEYLYLGPDENMHTPMIQWIADYSKRHGYKPGAAFISSKPIGGINHKEYGVTSKGLNVYMQEVLLYMGIDPRRDVFTIKMSGGPDGDVAGNQILNLYNLYPKTAQLTALTDGTGTIYDKEGLDLAILKGLFYKGKGICAYPPERISEGGFLINKRLTRHPTPYVQETACFRKIGNKVIEDWLSGSDTNHVLRSNLNRTKTDIFIPAGGRPRTLNEMNIQEFFDETGRPTAKAIIEGANLYLSEEARHVLEEKGVLIVKDSSANKGGVICSSFEVLCGLALREETFLEYKDKLVTEILERLEEKSLQEASLMLRTHRTTGHPLSEISDQISKQINQYKYQILDYFDHFPLSSDPQDPLIQCFLNYCLPTLRTVFSEQLLNEVPEHHKKAIIACHIASYMVYSKGLNWSPSIVDILPLILSGTALT